LGYVKLNQTVNTLDHKGWLDCKVVILCIFGAAEKCQKF